MYRQFHRKDNRAKRRYRCLESLESRQLMAANGLHASTTHVGTIELQEPPAVVSTEVVRKPTQTRVSTTRIVLPIVAQFSAESIREDSVGKVHLTLRRNPRDISDAIHIQVTGGDTEQLPMPSTIVIPAGESEVTLRLTPTNDTEAEKPLTLSYLFSASGHPPTSATILLRDDENPKFQNPALKHDVNNDGRVSSVDALMVINAMDGSTPTELDPSKAGPQGVFHDVNGDYSITALDALAVINSLGRSDSAISPQLSKGREVSPFPRIAIPQTTSQNFAFDSSADEEHTLDEFIETESRF